MCPVHLIRASTVDVPRKLFAEVDHDSSRPSTKFLLANFRVLSLGREGLAEEKDGPRPLCMRDPWPASHTGTQPQPSWSHQ